MTLDDLVAEGLFDPDAPDAADRRSLFQRALDAGASLDEIRQACEERWLHVLPTRLAILGGAPRFTIEEAAARAGLDAELGAKLWHALGLARRGDLECIEADDAIFGFYARLLPTFGEEQTLQAARAHGTAIAVMTDSEVTQVRSVLEAPQRVGGAGDVAIGELLVSVVGDLIAPLNEMLDRLHRHHLMAVGRRYTLWGSPPSEAGTTDIVVGFADLVGFTALGQTLEANQIDALLRTFEVRAAGTATSETTRLVKLIGDEAMFVAGTADDALAIAKELVDDPDLPPLRVGIAAGRVVARGGDVFGAPVNLAARLVATAQPGEILVDEAVADGVSDPKRLDARGPRNLPGFADPVEVYSA